jgi:hypothetical protein
MTDRTLRSKKLLNRLFEPLRSHEFDDCASQLALIELGSVPMNDRPARGDRHGVRLRATTHSPVIVAKALRFNRFPDD